MINQARRLVFLLLLLWLLFLLGAIAQAQKLSANPVESATASSMAARQSTFGTSDFDLWSAGHAANDRSPLQAPSGSVSALDLKAPEKARREYNQGYLLLMRKDLDGAVEHLGTAITIYPGFVAAHNALGLAYMSLEQHGLARDQFAEAVLLDGHLPASYLNLGCAQLALQDYGLAEESVKKAVSLAPLDMQLATALTYAELMNHDYAAVLATTQQVHSRKHKGAAMVHYYAAAAWQDQNNLPETRSELETLLREDPNSPAADKARLTLNQIKADPIQANPAQGAEQRKEPPAQALVTEVNPAQKAPTQEEVAARLQLALQAAKQQKQVAEAEAAEAKCATCGVAAPGETALAAARGSTPSAGSALAATGGAFSLRSVVDEVAVLFAATDHGKPVTDLTREEVGILDNQKPPARITGFRNEAELPLRLGIIIDTSESVTAQFSFEQRAAIHFLQKVLGDDHDLAFVVGVANSVLLVQDFTNDQQRISHAIDQLAPAGGTALWDAVSFAAQKLASRPETQPVARMLVVISDGKDNSSSATLQEAIARAQAGEVFVYSVSPPAVDNPYNQAVTGNAALVGDRALKLLAERTGGAAFLPNSLHGLDHGLEELQQVIRSRYLISYKPALFKSDGQYRTIDISAEKSGHKLQVYARKGYYARVDSLAPDDF